MNFQTSIVQVFIPVLVSSCGGQGSCKLLSIPLIIRPNLVLNSGGKSGVLTIENDHDFSVALVSLLKRKDTCGIGVEFDLDNMDGFCIRKSVCSVH
jgi:hypothetical protein